MFRRRQRDSEREEEGRDCSALCDTAGRRLILKFLQDVRSSTHKMTPTPPPLFFFHLNSKIKNVAPLSHLHTHANVQREGCTI